MPHTDVTSTWSLKADSDEDWSSRHGALVIGYGTLGLARQRNSAFSRFLEKALEAGSSELRRLSNADETPIARIGTVCLQLAEKRCSLVPMFPHYLPPAHALLLPSGGWQIVCQRVLHSGAAVGGDTPAKASKRKKGAETGDEPAAKKAPRQERELWGSGGSD